MRIGLDYIGTIGMGGNSTYSKNLINAIISVDHTNQYYFYVYLHDFLLGRFKSKKYDNVHWRPAYASPLGLPIPDIVIRAFNSLAIRFWSKIDRLDIFHFTNPLNFISGLKKSIVTIHDLSSFHNGEWSKDSSRLLLSKVMKNIVVSSVIIAVSEYTKKDIVRTFGVNPDRIAVIYEAADSKKYYPDFDPAYLKDKFGIGSYLLYVGQLQPRKNIINILAAYARLVPELKQKYPLVLVGRARDESYAKLITEAIVNYQLVPHVKILGSLDDDSVRKLYSGARALIFPSFLEGFGLPVLESLQCGTPVITSSTSSLPEVAGDAGALVNPEDINEINHAIEKILTDEDFYKNIKNRSLAQAKKFNWEKAARETVALY